MLEPPLVSVFTPSHDPRFLTSAYLSLAAQTEERWEWLVLLNGGASWSPPTSDPRVRCLRVGTLDGVGAAKRMAVAETIAPVLVELDHDDLLTEDALAEVLAALDAHPDAALVYSHAGGIDQDGRPLTVAYDPSHGWDYDTDQVTVAGASLMLEYPVAMAPTPHNVSLIWYAPNHLRAFRRAAYDAVGGYDAGLDVLDDLDLMARLYQVGGFHRIDRVLYLQREHAGRTSAGPADQPQTETNARIQVRTVELYDEHIAGNAVAWARREGLASVALGNLEGLADLATSSVGVIHARSVLHLAPDPAALMAELHRVLAPGGLLLSSTPSTDGRGAFSDPMARSWWNANSFWHYTEPAYRDGIAVLEEGDVRFQTSRLRTHHPSAWHVEHGITIVEANLIALKGDTPRNGGPMFW